MNYQDIAHLALLQGHQTVLQAKRAIAESAQNSAQISLLSSSHHNDLVSRRQMNDI